MGSRSSLAKGSETTVNPEELSNKLKELQNSPVSSGTNADSGGQQQPKRPPRFKRDKRIRNMTLPREMKLHSIAEDQQQTPLEDSNKQPKVPQPVGMVSGTTSDVSGTSAVVEGGSPNNAATNQPVVPMPNNILTKNEDGNDSAQTPTVPMPMEFGTMEQRNNGTMEHWNGDTTIYNIVPKSTSLDEGINLQQPVVPQPQTATLPTPKMGVHNEKLM